MTKKPTLKRIRRKTIADQVAEQLTQLAAGMQPGEKLPSERALMAELGVGRSSLREALRSLEIMGLLETRTGEGTFVATDKEALFRKPLEWGVFNGGKSLDHLLEARTVFEQAIVGLVNARITDSELAELEKVVAQMEQTGPPDFETFLAADLRFHDLIARATRNDVLYETIHLTRRIIGEERARRLDALADYRKAARHHRAVLEALKRRDKAATRTAMSEHMDYMSEFFKETGP